MPRITATLSGIERTLLDCLSQSQSDVTLHNLRLAAGKKVLSPQNDPSTFLKLSNLQSQLSLVHTTLANVTAASNRLTQARTNASSIHDQLDTIRELLTDPDSNLDNAHRAAAQARIDEALQAINTLATSDIDGRRLLDGSANYRVYGRNAAQVRDVRVYSTGANGQSVAAKQAELTYSGTSRYASANATIQITGNSGTSSTIAISTDDTLEAVAAQINAQHATTGVSATVQDNTLKLVSDAYGSSRKAAVHVLSGTFTTSGGDGAGTAYGRDVVYGTTPAVSGTVLQAGTQASLAYTGAAGKTTAAATFTLTGRLGSDTITVTLDEDLDDVAKAINAVSYKTGITAAVDSDQLTFTSVDYGIKASAAVTVSSGTFNTTGGNGDGTANGTNAVARINGITYSGNTLAQPAEIRHREKTGLMAHDATVRVTGALGSADITMTTGQSLSTVAANINAQVDTTGIRALVDGNDLVLRSTDRGADAQASVEVLAGTFDTVGTAEASGQAEVSGKTNVDGNRFTINENGTHYEVEFAGGFSGDFQTMTLEGGALQFALSTSLHGRSTLALPSLQTAQLGGLSGNLSQIAAGGTSAGLGDNTAQAIRIVDEALGQVEQTEGLMTGYFNSGVTSALELLSDLQDTLDDSIAQTDGYNEDEEETLRSNAEALVANAQASLSILYDQRQLMVQLLQHIAGLD